MSKYRSSPSACRHCKCHPSPWSISQTNQHCGFSPINRVQGSPQGSLHRLRRHPQEGLRVVAGSIQGPSLRLIFGLYEQPEQDHQAEGLRAGRNRESLRSRHGLPRTARARGHPRSERWVSKEYRACELPSEQGLLPRQQVARMDRAGRGDKWLPVHRCCFNLYPARLESVRIGATIIFVVEIEQGHRLRLGSSLDCAWVVPMIQVDTCVYLIGDMLPMTPIEQLATWEYKFC